MEEKNERKNIYVQRIADDDDQAKNLLCIPEI